MFGFSFSEFVVLMIVAIVVIGPKDLPKVLRKVGRWSGQLRRMAGDLRAQSGIDEVLRTEGLADDIAEIRKLARGEIDSVRREVEVDLGERREQNMYATHDREYPRDGADSYLALPDTALVYAQTFPPSALAKDPLYVTGDPEGAIPEPPAPEPEPERGPDGAPQPEAKAEAQTEAKHEQPEAP